MKNEFLKITSVTMIMAIVFFSIGCKKNGEINNTDLKISFQTQVNGASFGINDTYRNANDVDVKFESFQFYLSDIIIVNSNGDSRLVSEIELFKLNESGIAALDFSVPFGDYESIQFGIGVKNELNTADPSNYAEEDHPLNTLQNTYWGWASMYRFIMSEGRFDGDLNGEFEGTFAYHTGRELSYRVLNIPHTFEIKKKKSNTLSFIVDLYQLLEKPGNEVDVTTEPYYHGGTENEDISTRISDNMQGSISIAP